MMEETTSELYAKYNNVVKVLIAQVEAKYEAIPEQILNELRAFTDHVARCHLPNRSEEDVRGELNRADGHLTRIILDCFKYLNVKQKQLYVEQFKDETFFIDLNLVDDGNFIVRYYALAKEARDFVEKAKKLESMDKDEALSNYQFAYNSYTELEDLVEKHRRGIAHAKRKSIISLMVSFVKFIGKILRRLFLPFFP
jgi:hypothetical protein